MTIDGGFFFFKLKITIKCTVSHSQIQFSLGFKVQTVHRIILLRIQEIYYHFEGGFAGFAFEQLSVNS